MKKKIINFTLACCIATQSCAAFSLSMPQWLKWSNLKITSQGIKNKALEAKNDPTKFCKENPKTVAGLAVGALGTFATAATYAYKFFAKTAKTVNLPISIPALTQVIKLDATTPITNAITSNSTSNMIIERLKQIGPKTTLNIIYSIASITAIGLVFLILKTINKYSKKNLTPTKISYPNNPINYKNACLQYINFKPNFIKDLQIDFQEECLDGFITPVTKTFKKIDDLNKFKLNLTGDEKNTLITNKRKKQLKEIQENKAEKERKKKEAAEKKINEIINNDNLSEILNIKLNPKTPTEISIKNSFKNLPDEDVKLFAKIIKEKKTEDIEGEI